MNTENLQTLKIHRLSQAQYDRELAAGNIDESALYLTPEEEIDLSPYATIEQVNTKADTDHNHDSVYYTETEVDALLSGKSDTSHTHDGYMAKVNPVGSGFFSLNRKADTVVADYSSTFGLDCTAQGNYSHAEGQDTLAIGLCSHAEGYKTEARGDGSYAGGSQTKAIGYYSHAEGFYTTANGQYSHAEGYNTTAEFCAHAEGQSTTASGSNSHAEGVSTTASGDDSHAEGYYTTASGNYSHAEGYDTEAIGYNSHAEGINTTAQGNTSHAEGVYTVALDWQHAQGHYNNTTSAKAGVNEGTGDGTAFVIGNGTSSTGSNAFRVNYSGKPYAKSALTTTGCDYAEFFEWQDLNPSSEDRRGYFVTLDGDKIKIAEPNDYILGVISGQPSVIGNGDEDWLGRYVFDEFGAFVYEDFEYEVDEFDKETGEKITITKTGKKYKENPNYDPTIPYIQREDRPEWDYVGMLGVLSVRDDGTCQVNGYCAVAEGGIATASETGYRVIKRVNDNIVKVIFR